MNTEHLRYTPPEQIAWEGQGLRCLTDPYFYAETPTPAHELLSAAQLTEIKALLAAAYRAEMARRRALGGQA